MSSMNQISASWHGRSKEFPLILTGVSGDIRSGFPSNYTVTLDPTSFIKSKATRVTVLFSWSGGSTSQTVATGSSTFTAAFPAAVYNLAVNVVVTIRVRNADTGTDGEGSTTLTVGGLPTGGSISVSGSDRIHVFNSSGTFSVPAGFTRSMRVNIIAGGAGGCSGHTGGGSGAGGFKFATYTVGPGNHTVTVGAGGTGGTANVGNKNNKYKGATVGSNSKFGGFYTATRGGRGVSNNKCDGNNYNGESGGSGGGGAGIAGGSGISGEGNAGGKGSCFSGTTAKYSAAGGGGRGSAGQNPRIIDVFGEVTGRFYQTRTTGGTGGAGAAEDVTGNGYRKGGGGAGGNWTLSGGGGNGSDGGGYGNVGRCPRPNGINGTANTGGGGGGGGWDGDYNDCQCGGNGGSGWVAVRYTV